MPAPWYAAALPERIDAAWEIYHENSKREPGERLVPARSPGPVLDYGHLPLLTPEAVAPPPGALAATQLAAILTAGDGAAGAEDRLLTFVYAAAIAGLEPVMTVFDPSTRGFRLLRDDVRPDEVGALLADAQTGAVAAVLFLAVDLEAATREAGERGYRDALLATGRRLARLEAAATDGTSIRSVAYHDRAADSLLFLDGLSRSVLATVVIGAPVERDGAT